MCYTSLLLIMNTIYGLTSARKCEKINRQHKSGCSTSDEDRTKIKRSTDYGVSYKLEEKLPKLEEKLPLPMLTQLWQKLPMHTELWEKLPMLSELQAFAAAKSESLTCSDDTFVHVHNSDKCKEKGVLEEEYDFVLANESPGSIVLKVMMIALEEALQEITESKQHRQEMTGSEQSTIAVPLTPSIAGPVPLTPSIAVPVPLTPLQIFREKTPQILCHIN